MPVILWTDALIFLLLGLVAAYVIHAARHEHLRAPWRHVAHNRIGMGAAVVLAFYLLIGLLDSMHFHPRLDADPAVGESAADEQVYSNEIISVLDWIATPLRERTEKTYSAPFATHLYSKETVERPDGTKQRVYPRLEYGGAHLQNPDDRLLDIGLISLAASLEALIAWLLPAVLLVLYLGYRAGNGFRKQCGLIVRGQTPVPWLVILLTTLVMLLLCFVLSRLSLGYHVLGTDKVGQDVLYQALKSIRTGLVIGTLTTLVMLPFAILTGIAAGYFRGRTDDIIQYLYTTLSSIPGVLLIAAAILLLQVYMANNADSFASLEKRADLRLLFLCIILGITSWTGLCRMLRGETLKLSSIDFIQASQAFGVSNARILSRHVLPNVMHIVLISVVLDFSGLVLAEAVLSYVNIGVDPSMNSWGNMINSARLEMAREPIVWWSLMAAFSFMFVLVLSANLFADAVRDALDPRVSRN